MLRKCLKGFYCVALLLLAIGLILFVPGVKRSQLAQAETLSTGDDSLSQLSGDAWMDADALSEVTSDDIVINRTYIDGRNTYVVKTALGLASVAYHVNNGDSEYVSGTFILVNDIDLQGAIWTPIGTAENPFFRGFFSGEGHSISNVVVQPAFVSEGSGQGLFGNITNATISDLILSGTYSISVSTGGTLVGVATNSTIISVHDNALDDVGGNAGMSQIYTIGSGSTNVQVFLSQAVAWTGITLTGTTLVNGGILDQAEVSHIDSQASVTYAGYAVYYCGLFNNNTESVEFFVNGTLVGDASGKRVRVLVDNSFNDFSQTLNKANPFYYTHKVRLRESLALTDTNVPYPIRAGYRSTIEQPSAQDCSIIITDFDQPEITLNLNYGYGNRNITISGSYYDYALDDILAESVYLTDRLGYSLTAVSTQSKGDISQTPSFYYNYPSYTSDTLIFEWAPLNDRAFDFYFLVDSESYADGSLTYADVSSAVGGVSVNKGSLDTNLVATNGRYTVKGLTSDDNNLTNEVTLTFTLDAGYEISVVSEDSTQESLVINEDDINNGFDGNSNYVYSKTSGIYLNFTNFTGEGSSYNSANANNDSYCQVSASGSVRNTSGSGVVSSREERTYSITISNIAGTTGNVYIVVKRAAQEINVVTSVYAFEDADLDSFAYTYGGVEYRENSFYIKGGIGQTVEITLRIDDDVNYFVLSSNTGTSSLTATQVPVDGGRQMTVNGRTYYSYVTFRITINNLEEGMTFNVGIGGLRSYFKFEVQDGEGNILTPSDTDNSTKGISAVVNDIDS